MWAGALLQLGVRAPGAQGVRRRGARCCAVNTTERGRGVAFYGIGGINGYMIDSTASLVAAKTKRAAWFKPHTAFPAKIRRFNDP